MTPDEFRQLAQIFMERARQQWRTLNRIFSEEIRVALYARPGDSRTRALRRTETARRSAMHAAYRRKTRNR